MKFVLLGIAGLATIVIASSRWRWALYGALIMAVFEGALRKWLFPGAGEFIYFSKDFLLLGAYLGFANESKKIRKYPVPGKLLLLALAIMLGSQIINPNSNSFLLSLFGLKAYLLYLPLIYVVQFVFRTRAEFETFLKWFLFLALPVFLLGAFQFTQPPDSFWNKYASSDDYDVATFGEYARITATFSYIAGLTSYIILVLALTMPNLLLIKNPRWRLIFLAIVVLAVGNTFMTGSRSPVLGLAILVAGFWIGSQFFGVPAEQKRASFHLVVIAIALVAGLTLFSKAAEALKERALENQDEGIGRVEGILTQPWKLIQNAGAVGYGAGITLPGTVAIQHALGLAWFSQDPPGAEIEPDRIMLETGFPTFLVWYLFRIYFLCAFWQMRGRLRDPFLRQLALGALLAQFYYLINGNGIVVNHIAGVFNWFLAGFICLLPKLDREALPSPVIGATRRGIKSFSAAGQRLVVGKIPR